MLCIWFVFILTFDWLRFTCTSDYIKLNSYTFTNSLGQFLFPMAHTSKLDSPNLGYIADNAKH